MIILFLALGAKKGTAAVVLYPFDYRLADAARLAPLLVNEKVSLVLAF